MAKKTNNTVIDITKLSQRDAARLSGKSPNWLRDNEHLSFRNADGSYDGRKLLAALQHDFQVAELPPHLLEIAFYIARDITAYETHNRALSRNLQEVEASFGPAGLAAVTKEIMLAAEEELRAGGDYSRRRPDAEEIQRKADEQIAEIANYDARRDMREVVVCGQCGKYRWGRTWKQPPFPKGYVDSGVDANCPSCDKALGG